MNNNVCSKEGANTPPLFRVTCYLKNHFWHSDVVILPGGNAYLQEVEDQTNQKTLQRCIGNFDVIGSVCDSAPGSPY